MIKNYLMRMFWNMKRIFLVALFLCFSIGIISTAKAETFSFEKDLEGWGSWGEGAGKYVPGLGHSGKGAVELTCSKGQEVTMHKNFTLKPGRYQVTAWLRALDVQMGQWDYSIWLFYQAAENIVSPVTNLKGTFEWSKVTYTMEVNERSVDIWFRLKAQGSLWLDDISVEPYTGPADTFHIEKSTKDFPKPNPIGQGIRCHNCYRWMDAKESYCIICGGKLEKKEDYRGHTGEVAPVRMLLDFEEKDRNIENKRHYLRTFSEKMATLGKQSAVIRFAEYNNLNISDKEMQNWSGYDYLAMDVYNPLTELANFSVCINDKEGGGYWDQLNHNTTLAPGWNYLKFEVNRYVGERGSVRNKRYLDLGNIKKAWFAVAPEDKRKYGEEFYIDNVRLTKIPHIATPFPKMLLFDFVKEDFRTQKGFIGIGTNHLYHKDIGFGFVDAEIWRAHDSIYADSLYRDGIFINKGSFRVDVPNGKYVVRLVPYALGEWYEHFWTRRTIKIQRQTVLQERRSTAKEYLKDFLRFSEVEPKPTDNAYDLYLKTIFKEIVTEVEVTDGKISINCDGDDSAIFLNSLIIYPIEQKKEGDLFMQQLEQVQKDEFETLCRKLESKPPREQGIISDTDRKRGFYTALIDTGTQLRYSQLLKSTGRTITLKGGRLQRPVQALLVRNLRDTEVLKIASSSLKTENGLELNVRPEWVRYGVAQYQSHSMNHETYELAPRFLRVIPEDGMTLDKDYSLLIWYQIPINQQVQPGTYSGELSVTLGKEKVLYPVTLQVEDFELPEADIAVGFFGLDPVSFDYYDKPGVSEIKKKNRRKVLQALHDRGFTTWSSLPESKFIKGDDAWILDAKETDDLMTEAKKLGFSKKVFTYGGPFPIPLDTYGPINDVPHEIYRQKTSQALKLHMEKKQWLPVVFDISDEAAGYSQTVDRDFKRAQILEQYYPFLGLGGYSHPIKQGEAGYELNRKLTDISLSSVDEGYLEMLKKDGKRWGWYNSSSGLTDDNRATFSQKLIASRKQGCDHFLGWHLVLSQNYPYYDLDGRERDAMMIFLRKDEGFDFALNFELAALGLEEYRLMLRSR